MRQQRHDGRGGHERHGPHPARGTLVVCLACLHRLERGDAEIGGDLDLGHRPEGGPGFGRDGHLRATLGARGQMAFDLQTFGPREGAVDVGGELLEGMRHDCLSDVPAPLVGSPPPPGLRAPGSRPSTFASAMRPRWTRDFTVPTGTSRIFAMSS